MLYITLKEILDNKLYSLEKVEQLKTFIDFEANGFTEATPIPLSAVLKSNGLVDTCWVLKLTEQGQRVLKVYTLWNAEKVLHIWEKAYPNENAIRLTIEAARKAIENPTEENKKAAAALAARATLAASSAAADAAYDAASAAADAAYDAARAAVFAAEAASYDEAYKEFEKEQEIELLRLIEEATL